jgi:hypothetical protein
MESDPAPLAAAVMQADSTTQSASANALAQRPGANDVSPGPLQR